MRNIQIKLLVALAIFGVGLFGVLMQAPAASATAGINSTINFQGRLLTNTGAVVSNGTYNMEFKVYSGGTGCVGGGTSPCGGSLLWTEDWVYGPGSGGGWQDNRVVVTNGYFSVNLGSICPFTSTTCAANQGNSQTNTVINFNQYPLWLSMNVGNTSTAATFSAASGNGEMTPFREMASAVYAEDAAQLGGIASTGFIQNTVSQQTNAANMNILSAGTADIGANVQAAASGTAAVIAAEDNTSSTGDLFDADNSSGSPLAAITSAGNLKVASTIDTETATGLAIGPSNATSITLDQATTVTSPAIAGVSSGSGTAAPTTLTVTGATGGASSANGANGGIGGGLSVTGGGGGSETGTSGSNAGGAGGALSLTSGSGGAATSGGTDTGGNGGTITLAAGNGGNGSTTNGSGGNILLQAGSAGSGTGAAGSAGSVTVKNAGNSTTGFQIQNAAGIDVEDASTNTTNLVSQPNVTGSTASDWTAKNSASAPVGDTTTPFESTASIKTTASGSVAYSGLQTSTFTTPITASTQYEITFWAKCSSSITTFTYGHQDNGSDSNFTNSATCNTTWQQYSGHWSTGTIGTPNIYMDAGTPANATTIWVDGVSLVQTATNAAVDYQPGNLYLNGVIASPTIFENSANTAGALQVQNASGSNVLSVNTASGQLVLGTASALAGSLVFDDSGSANTATVSLPSASGGTESFNLPNNGTTGQTICTSVASSCSGTYLTAGGTVILAPSATQTIAPTGAGTTGLVIEQTSTALPTADIFDVYGTSSATKFLQVTSTAANAGAIILNAQGTGNGTSIGGVASAAGGGAGSNAGTTFSVTGEAGQAGASGGYAGGTGGVITLTGGTGGASTSTAANSNGGAVTIDGGTAGSGGSGTAGTGGTLTLQGGNAQSGGTDGGVTIDAGSGATTANGTVNIGPTDSSAINIGANGSSNLASTIDVDDTTGTGNDVVNIGSAANNTSDVTTIQGGSNTTTAILLAPNAAGGIMIGGSSGTGTITLGQSTANNTIAIGTANTLNTDVQTINIGNGTGAGSGKSVITIGSTANASSLSLQGGSVGVGINAGVNSPTNINTGSSTGAVTIGNASDSGGVAINADAASNFTTASGVLTLQGVGVTVATTGANNINLSPASTGAVVINSGSGTPTLDFGTGTGTIDDIGFLNASSGAGNTLQIAGQTGAATYNGGNVAIAGGNAGTTGTGGTLQLNGGAASATAGSGSGAITVATGNGTAGSGSTVGGAVGALSVTGGNGGAGGATSAGAAGGNITVQAGYGGSAVSGYANGNGGSITLAAGAAGNGAGTAGSNGQVLIKNLANSSTGFQLQNASATNLVNVDSNDVNTSSGSAMMTTHPAKVLPVYQSMNATASGNAPPASDGDAPRTVGDIIVLAVNVFTSGASVNTVSGGNVTTWTQIVGNSDATSGDRVELWYGVATSTGGSTISVTYNSGGTSGGELVAEEFTAGMGTGTTWSVGSSNYDQNASSTTVTYPSLTSGSSSGSMYFGYGGIGGTGEGSQGTTTGFTYAQSPDGNEMTWNGNLAASTAYQPTAVSTPAAASDELGAILIASADGTLSVNGATTITGGNSQAAFQVQNAAGSDLFDVDTADDYISIGTGNTGNTGPWQQNDANLPDPMGQNSAVTADGYVYDVAGYDNGSVDGKVWYAQARSDGTLGAFTATTTSAADVEYQSVVATNGYIYQLGGYTGSAYSNVVQYAQVKTDGTLGTWYTTTVLPTATMMAATVVANGYIYMIGGQQSGGVVSSAYYAKINANGTLGAWTTVASELPSILRQAAAVYVNGNIIVMGGGIGSGNGLTAVYTASVSATNGSFGAQFSSSGNGSLIYGRSLATAEVVNGYVYLVGGGSADTGDTPTDIIQYGQVSSAGNVTSWTASTNILPQLEMWQGGFTLNGYLYVLGGVYTTGGLTSANIYYASTARVTIGSSLDLVGATSGSLTQGGDQSTGSSGGTLTAGDTNIVGTFQVADQADFNQGVAVNGNLSTYGQAAIQNSTNSSTEFQVQNASGDQLLGVNSTNPITDLTNNQNNNEILNSSFEGGQGTTGWTATTGSTTAISQTATQAYVGSDSMQVTTGAAASQGAEYSLTSGTNFLINTEYTFTAYVRSFNNGGNWTTMEMGYNSGGTNNNCLSSQNVAWNGWTKFQCSFTTGATLTTPYVYIEQSDTTGRTFYVDGVELQRFSLLSDPNMLSGVAFGAANWQAMNGSATVQLSATYSNGGTDSAKVTTSSTTVTGIVQDITLTPNTQYSLWYYQYTAGTSIGQDLEAGYNNGSTSTACQTAQPVTSGQWSYYFCTFTTPSTNTGTPYMYIDDNTVPTSGLTWYVDNVQLNIGNALGSYEDGQLALNGTITSPTSIQNGYDSTSEFNIQNAEGQSLFNIDSTNEYITMLTGTGYSVRFRANQYGVNIETGGADMYLSSWSNGAMTGTQYTFARGFIGNGNLYVGDGTGSGNNGGVTQIILDQGSADPGTAYNGGMYWNTTNNQFRCGDSGEWVDCLGGIAGASSAASGAQQSCGTGGTACTAFSTSGTAIPANYCQNGKTIRIYAAGVFGTYSTAPTLNLGFYYGASTTKSSDTLLGSLSPTVTPTVSLSGEPWTVNFTINCYGTTWNTEGTWVYQNSTTSTTTNVMLQFPNTSTAEGGGATNIYLFPTWSTSAQSANTITLDQWIVSVN